MKATSSTHNNRRNRETPLPRLVAIPKLSPQAQIVRARAAAFLSKAGVSPFHARFRNGNF